MNDRAHVIFPPGQGRGPTNPYRTFILEEVEQSIPGALNNKFPAIPERSP